MDLAKMAAAYIKIRDAKEACVLKQKEEIAEKYDSKLEKLSQVFLAHMRETGEKSCKTDAGTIIKGTRSRFWAPDALAFQAFVMANNAPELFEARIHQGNYKQFITDNPDIIPPVNTDSKFVITVRRPSK